MTVAVETETVLRPFRPADRPAIRAIACLTAFRNRGHTAMVPDAELFADYWTRYYTDFEPDNIIVAEQRDGARESVVGYLLGCRDTQHYQRVMARRIAPPVLARLLYNSIAGVYGRGSQAGALLRWMCLRAWRESPPLDARRFPAHYHANVLPEGVGQRLYTRMALAFIDRLEALGVSYVHGQVTDWRTRGSWDRFVTRYTSVHPGARLISTTCETTLGRDVLGETRPMVNRAICGSTEDFRGILTWMGATYRL